jgi:uncharacterized membrane protein YhhN
MSNALTMIYALIALLEISAEFFDLPLLRVATKPLLMPVLIFAFVQGIGTLSSIQKIMVVAFFFSWIGDVALMFVPKNIDDTVLIGISKHPNFFLAGLGGFLVTHILYISAFVKSTDNKTALLKRNPMVAAPLIAYFVALVFWIFPPVPAEMKIPVLVYSLTIAVMVLAAMNNFGRVPRNMFLNGFAGALLFMLSDSIIAVNKFIFNSELPLAGVCIMTLYITGQYFIAKAFAGKNAKV